MNILFRKLYCVLRKVQRILSLKFPAPTSIDLHGLVHYEMNTCVLLKIQRIFSFQFHAPVLIDLHGKVRQKISKHEIFIFKHAKFI